MPRKPAHLELTGGKGPRQRIWEAIRLLSKASPAPFTEGDIWDATEGAENDIEMGAVRDYRRALVKAGYLKCVTEATSTRIPATYLMARDNGVEAPRLRKDGTPVIQGLAQEQMWRTLRTRKGDINASELVAHASTGAIQIALFTAKDYLRNLHLASYLQCTQEGHGSGNGGVQARYRLISDTGPRPPMVQRTDALFDPNLDAIVWIKPINEETCIYGK